MTDIEDFAAGDDHEFDKINDEGHAKWCDKWLAPALDCSCPVRWRDMPDPNEDRAMEAFFEQWEDDNPVRTPKGAKPKQGRDGDSVKLLSKIIGRGKKK